MRKRHELERRSALLEVLEAAVELGTTDARTIADHLCRSVNTVRNEWAEIIRQLEAGDRPDAMAKARELGLI